MFSASNILMSKVTSFYIFSHSSKAF